MPQITGIYRYPIKGLSPQPLPEIALDAGKPFPFDRLFALARPGADIDANEPKWCKKGHFVMLMLDAALASVQTDLDIETLQFKITQGGALRLSADLNSAEGRAAVESFFSDQLLQLNAPARLVRARDGHFMDKPDNVVSLINLATVRAVEKRWGCMIDPLRFRANFYIDGVAPWAEFGWLGGEVRLGAAVLRADRRNGRCNATNVNPRTGERDLQIPQTLRHDYGHKDLGIYLMVEQGGSVAVGDTLIAPAAAPLIAAPAALATVTPGAGRHMCRGCFFIYDEATGSPATLIAAGTPFADLPAQWRCTDCGAEKSMFVPYVAATN